MLVFVSILSLDDADAANAPADVLAPVCLSPSLPPFFICISRAPRDSTSYSEFIPFISLFSQANMGFESGVETAPDDVASSQLYSDS